MDILGNLNIEGSITTSGGTTINTATNLGVGTGVFSGKTDTDLQFYSLSGGTNTTLLLNGNTIVIDTIDTNTDTNFYMTGGTLDGSLLVLNRTDKLSGATIDLSSLLDDTNTNFYVTGGTLNNNSVIIDRNDTNSILILSGGTNVTITEPLTGTFKIDSPDIDTGEVNTASNFGVGQEVFSGKSGTDLQFYSLSGGTNTTLTLSNDTIVIGTTQLTVADDDSDAILSGITSGQYYQTSGNGAAPLNAVGIVMVKQ